LARWAELQPPLLPSTQIVIQEALDLTREAMVLEPDNSAIAVIRIPILLAEGVNDLRPRGQDPLPAFQEALVLARKAQVRHPQEPTFAALIALACMRKMTQEINRGTPPWASFEEGLSQARALQARFPDLPGAYRGLTSLWVERAEFERVHGLDPRPSVAAALDAVAKADARGLRSHNPHWAAGDARLIEGQYLLATEGGGEDAFNQAAESYRLALRTNPNLLAAHGGVAEALLGVAQGRLERGLDPGAALAKAQDSLDQLGDRDIAPDQADYLRGQLALLKGRLRLSSGGDPNPDWARAETAFKQATRHTGLAKAQVGRAEVRARAFLHSARPEDRAKSLVAARSALRMDPLRAEAWLWIATVEQEAFRRGEAKASVPAKEAWTKALTLDANLRRWAKTLGMP
jgi:hypothetical protein